MTSLAPAAWWRGLGGLTRSGTQIGEMFGLYGLAGKASAVIGPLAYGAIIGLLQPSLARDAYRIAILSLLVLMVVGFLIVRRVPEGREPDGESALATPLEPAIVPPGEAP